ncbi:hypothetical protein BVRB_6g127920 isoform A [Beta vulgaris subsp. vulgaris]|nr:hypothetical protein BVRB_6g127920 isoform A [Beta vulgaris subsp. vulgaris]
MVQEATLSMILKDGLFIMTGDVLPCFDASIMNLVEDALYIIQNSYNF